MHWVMIDMAKLSKEKRDRIGKLDAQGLCINCECKPQHSRKNCQSCLQVLYAKKKYGDPIKAAQYESSLIRQGRLMPIYDKSFVKRKVRAS